MSLLFVDGFDSYGADADLVDKWDVANASDLNYNSTGGRFGGGAVEIFDDVSTALVKYIPVSATAVSTDELGVGFAFNANLIDATEAICMLLAQNGDIQCSITLASATGTLEARRAGAGGTLLASSASNVITIGTWHWIEAHFVVDGSTGKMVIKVDGTEVINITGQNTQQNNTFPNCRAVAFGGNTGTGSGSNFWSFDDVIIYNTDGSGITDFVDDMRIQTIRPNGAGDASDGTPDSGNNWERVDDAGANDGDSSYVDFSTAGDKDLYACGNLPETADTVHAVVVNNVTRADSTDPREIKAKVKEGTTEGDGDDRAVLNGANFKTSQGYFTTNPDTAAAWSSAEVDAMQIGLEVVI